MSKSNRPRLLDLFCGAGGCSVGYHRAGFEVVGVDIKPQPRYPFLFCEGDAIELVGCLLRGGYFKPSLNDGPTLYLQDFDAIHASPPCQKYSVLAAMHKGRDYPDLLPRTRKLLARTGKPFVIENVETAPMDRASSLFGHGVLLCGSMFGLGVERGYLRRHRCFETSFAVEQPGCQHEGAAVGVYGHGGHSGKRRMLYRKEAAIAMGIDWMSRDEMAQAIPPAYTEFIGKQLIRALEATP